MNNSVSFLVSKMLKIISLNKRDEKVIRLLIISQLHYEITLFRYINSGIH